MRGNEERGIVLREGSAGRGRKKPNDDESGRPRRRRRRRLCRGTRKESNPIRCDVSAVVTLVADSSVVSAKAKPEKVRNHSPAARIVSPLRRRTRNAIPYNGASCCCLQLHNQWLFQ